MTTKILLICLITMLTGCGIHHGLDIDIQGSDLKTPYGSGTGHIIVHSTWGKCPVGVSNGSN